MSLHGAYHHCTSRDMCRCRHPRERARGEATQATEQVAPADATSTAAPSAAAPVETVPAPETAPVQAPAEPDTMPVSSDTAAGIATTATMAAPAGATAV